MVTEMGELSLSVAGGTKNNWFGFPQGRFSFILKNMSQGQAGKRAPQGAR